MGTEPLSVVSEGETAARAACAAWWGSFGESMDPEGEWEGLDETERSYWRHVAAMSAAQRDGFDYIDLGMLLNLIEDLAARVPAYSLHADEGDNEACDRARAAVDAYRPVVGPTKEETSIYENRQT